MGIITQRQLAQNLKDEMDTFTQTNQDDNRRKWMNWLDLIKHNGVNLTEKEEAFCEDIAEKLELYPNYTLSPKQAEWLESIYSNRTP